MTIAAALGYLLGHHYEHLHLELGNLVLPAKHGDEDGHNAVGKVPGCRTGFL